jgi:hypothetical protein
MLDFMVRSHKFVFGPGYGHESEPSTSESEPDSQTDWFSADFLGFCVHDLIQIMVSTYSFSKELKVFSTDRYLTTNARLLTSIP